MRYIHTLFLFLLVTSSAVFAQDSNALTNAVHIEGQIVGAENMNIILANQARGGSKAPLAKVLADKKGRFVMDVNVDIDDYYYIGVEDGDYLNLVLQGGEEIKIYGDTKDLANISNIIGSKDSELLNEFMREFKAFKFQEDSLRQVMLTSPENKEEVNTYFRPIAESFYAYRNNFINSNQKSPALIVTLNSINQDREWATYKTVVDLLYKSFPLSPTVNSVNTQVIKKEAQMRQQKATNSLFKPGTLAKEIALPGVNGDTLRLSDMRGKVVLIDFWASWCGPCRRENPNVVKAYRKYAIDGFDVFSVSLDKSGARERWINAIKQDGLIWPNHVSDLKGWKSAAAAAYAVKSIPFTVLIDREGKIIGTNIRGAKLEAELSKIFGH